LRIPVLVLIALLAQLGWKSGERLAITREAAQATVDSLAREYYDAKFTFYPALATFRGIEGYDNILSTYSGRNMFRLLGRMRNITNSLSTFDEDSLTMNGWAEYKALLADMSAQTDLIENLEIWKKEPTLYVDACVDGILSLYLAKNRAGSADLSPRLRKIPQVVLYARRNLTEPHDLYCRAASARLDDFMSFLEFLRGEDFPGKDLEVIDKAIRSLQGFGAFIDSLSFEATPGAAIGYDDFTVLLDTGNMIGESPEDMRSFCVDLLDHLNAELATYPTDSTALRIEAAGPGLADTLDSRLESAAVFVRAKGLAGLPATFSEGRPGAAFVDMPAEARPFWGDLLAMEPPPETPAGDVTPIYVWPQIAGPGRTADALVTSQGIPGRYLQALVSAGESSAVARMAHDLFAVNGWTLYCQDMMAGQGFGGSRAVIAALERRRFYAAGTVAAVNMLVGESSLDEAAGFIAREAGVDPEEAQRLAVRYALEPELPMSYIIGERDIGRIRDEVSRMRGERFDLGQFHDDFLGSGRLPLYLIRNKVVTGFMGR
jgi:hypothetical protein